MVLKCSLGVNLICSLEFTEFFHNLHSITGSIKLRLNFCSKMTRWMLLTEIHFYLIYFYFWKWKFVFDAHGARSHESGKRAKSTTHVLRCISERIKCSLSTFTTLLGPTYQLFFELYWKKVNDFEFVTHWAKEIEMRLSLFLKLFDLCARLHCPITFILDGSWLHKPYFTLTLPLYSWNDHTAATKCTSYSHKTYVFRTSDCSIPNDFFVKYMCVSPQSLYNQSYSYYFFQVYPISFYHKQTFFL